MDSRSKHSIFLMECASMMQSSSSSWSWWWWCRRWKTMIAVLCTVVGPFYGLGAPLDNNSNNSNNESNHNCVAMITAPLEESRKKMTMDAVQQRQQLRNQKFGGFVRERETPKSSLFWPSAFAKKFRAFGSLLLLLLLLLEEFFSERFLLVFRRLGKALPIASIES